MRSWTSYSHPAVLIGAVALAGCADDAAAPRTGDEQAYAVEAQIGGLVQTVHVSDRTPARGDTLLIVSTVKNLGPTREVETRICGLDVTLPAHPGPTCAGYSMGGTLRTGDAVTQGDLRVVDVAPGNHEVRVRHLLDPDRWVTLHLTVR